MGSGGAARLAGAVLLGQAVSWSLPSCAAAACREDPGYAQSCGPRCAPRRKRSPRGSPQQQQQRSPRRAVPAVAPVMTRHEGAAAVSCSYVSPAASPELTHASTLVPSAASYCPFTWRLPLSVFRTCSPMGRRLASSASQPAGAPPRLSIRPLPGSSEPKPPSCGSSCGSVTPASPAASGSSPPAPRPAAPAAAGAAAPRAAAGAVAAAGDCAASWGGAAAAASLAAAAVVRDGDVASSRCARGRGAGRHRRARSSQTGHRLKDLMRDCFSAACLQTHVHPLHRRLEDIGHASLQGPQPHARRR